MMQDRLALFLVGLIFAVVAALFWHLLGSSGFMILLLVLVLLDFWWMLSRRT
jgi:hypothetical protein